MTTQQVQVVWIKQSLSSVAITVNTTFDLWCADKFTARELTNAASAGAAVNPDFDAFSNLLEYALGLEPKTSNRTEVVRATLTNGAFVLSFPHLKAAADVALSAEASGDLQSWLPASPTRITDLGPAEHVVVHEAVAANTARFFRLQVTR